MKTLHEINQRISEISGGIGEIEFGGTLIKPPKEEKRLGKELVQLTLAKSLLEKGVTFEYLKSELSRLLNFIKAKSAPGLFEDYYGLQENQGMDMKDAQKKYNKESGITEAKRYVKTIKFILQK